MTNTTPFANIEKLLVDASTAAGMLSISERKLWTLTNEQFIPMVRIGRSVRYDVRDLVALIDQIKNGEVTL